MSIGDSKEKFVPQGFDQASCEGLSSVTERSCKGHWPQGIGARQRQRLECGCLGGSHCGKGVSTYNCKQPHEMLCLSACSRAAATTPTDI